MAQSRERSEKFERGLKTRRAVVGDAYVDRGLAVADDFTWPMQVLVTENCWEDIWNRPGFDRRSRSILNLGMIACLGKMHEFEAHFRGAMRNGLTPKELAAILTQIAVYCGFPVAVDCFRVAKQILTAEGKKS